MKDNFQPLVCNDDDVFSFGETTFKAGHFISNLRNQIQGNVA